MSKGGKSGSRPPIIKKVVKKGGGHHGGSWKVAYADFVTAMMAFFLLLWLLGSVEQDKREGIASYFQRPLSAIVTSGNHSGGDRLVPTSEGTQKNGILAPGADGLGGERVDSLRIVRLQEELEEEILTNPMLQPFKDQLRFDLTERGLRIQIMDRDDVAMFEMGSAQMKSYARDLLHEIARVLNEVPNQLIISGHTDAMPYSGGEVGYGNWELSADRANAARRALAGGGIPADKVARIEGMASTELMYPDAPTSPANRRISILLLNRRTQHAMHLQEASAPPVVSP